MTQKLYKQIHFSIHAYLPMLILALAIQCNKSSDICTVSYNDCDTHLYSAQVRHSFLRDHTDLPATHMFIHKWNAPSCIACHSASPYFGWYSFPVLRQEGKMSSYIQ